MTPDVLAELQRIPSPDIAGAAGRVGGYVWTTARSFEVLGRLAVAAEDPRLKAALADVAARMAWQAEQWHRRLPALREVADADLVRSPSPETAAAFDDLERRAPTPATLGRALGLLAGLARAYATHAEAASPVTDGPVLRTLERTTADLDRAIATLEAAGVRPH